MVCSFAQALQTKCSGKNRTEGPRHVVEQSIRNRNLKCQPILLTASIQHQARDSNIRYLYFTRAEQDI